VFFLNLQVILPSKWFYAERYGFVFWRCMGLISATKPTMTSEVYPLFLHFHPTQRNVTEHQTIKSHGVAVSQRYYVTNIDSSQQHASIEV
jgi:hypothetical protein